MTTTYLASTASAADAQTLGDLLGQLIYAVAPWSVPVLLPAIAAAVAKLHGLGL